MLKKIALILISVFLICTTYGCKSSETEVVKKHEKIPVMLVCDDGIETLSDSKIYVTPGDIAVFSIKTDENCEIESISGGAKLVDGFVILDPVKYPTTIYVEAVKNGEPENTDVSKTDEPGTDKPTESPENTENPAETPTVTEAPSSSEHPVESPSETLSPSSSPAPSASSSPTESPTPLSYIIKQKDPQKLNKLSKADESAVNGFKVIYDTNGGTAEGFGSGKVQEVFSDDFYYCPNALADTGYFVRPGFVLKGYNTKSDGSGTYYAPGWTVRMSGAKQITLYCEWEKESPTSDFEYSENDDCVMITKYTGHSDYVVIPERINGKKVVAIGDNAFSGTKIKKLFLSKYVEMVSKDAFANCPELTTLYMTDNIISMSNNGLANVSKLYILAVHNPSYQDTTYGTAKVKYQLLLTSKNPRIIHISGSNGLYGIDPELLQKSINGDYSVINLSQTMQIPTTFYMELASYFVSKGDLVVFSPELITTQWGLSLISHYVWATFEGAFDAFSMVDISRYQGVFSSFAEFCKTKLSMNELTYETHIKSYDRFGSYNNLSSKPTSGYIEKQKEYEIQHGDTTFTTGAKLVETYGKTINASVSLLESRGAKVLLSYAALDISSLTDESKIKGAGDQKAYTDAIKSICIAEPISDITDYIFEPQYFYNSKYHLNSQGRALRTTQLANDINKYLLTK